MEPNEFEREFLRQFLHLVFGLFWLVVIFFVDKSFLPLIFLFGLFFVVLVLRLHKNFVSLPFLSLIVEKAERVHEKNFFGVAAVHFVFSLFVCSLVFYFEPKLVLVGAILVLSVGDSVSTLVGKLIGKTRVFAKTLEGTIAGFLSSFFVLVLLFPLHVAFFASFFGMLAEYLPVDDNYSVPLVAGLVIAVLI